MTEITEHKTNECNEAITITADERDPKYGNMSHNYSIRWVGSNGLEVDQLLQFQCGPIGEVGTNGITHEVLIAIMLDRMDGAQSGLFASAWNEVARFCLSAALAAFKGRTSERVKRGVEGTNVV